MKKTLFILLFLITTFSINAQSIFGIWENRDEETNEIDSLIEVYEKGGKAYAKIIEITDVKKRGTLCILFRFLDLLFFRQTIHLRLFLNL